jgi:toxin ParE1/3/4
VADFKLTRLALADLELILDYTIRTWSHSQAERYLSDLQSSFQELAEQPGIGRTCDAIRPDLFRMELGRHVVFYRRTECGIRIIRVLHASMLPENQLLEGGSQLL